MKKEELVAFIQGEIVRFADENDIEIGEVTESTRLMGSKGIFDSMDLVTFVVEIEELLAENFEIEVELTSDKAMSRRTSPFINPNTLATFITEQIHEPA